ncbi:MAG: thioredoxin family protein [Woeseiaceae bacterium]|nr:thioredoxin family protein [Woeseiaceae bacterium]
MSRLTMICAGFALAACGSDDAGTATDAAGEGVPAAVFAEGDPAAGIDWFDGSVDAAFRHAAETGKPVYLYWGAVWCPPCYAIAETVFKSPAFLERSKLFVPVYLDGDTENAQAYGERFGVLGYPTMIVFGPDGEELTRIPGGIDIQAYANVLDLALADTAPVASVVERVLAGDATLTRAECALLAYYSWGQDPRILADRSRVDAFRRMHAACPEDAATERSILYLDWLSASARARDDAAAPGAAGRTDAVQAFLRILADHELVKAAILAILLDGADIAAALTDPGTAERERVLEALETAYDRVEADESIYKRERIYTMAGRIELARIDDPGAELPAALRERIRAMVQWADESTPGVYQRQPIVNALANVLAEAGMDDVAKPLLLAELDRSKEPYYFMPALADIEQRAGNTAAALDWLRRAHATSRGPATRFQWGYYYVSGLIEMTPGDADAIRASTIALIDELQRSAGFYQRPKSQLARLEQALLAWSEAGSHEATLLTIRNGVQAICQRDEEPASRAACESFLGVL